MDGELRKPAFPFTGDDSYPRWATKMRAALGIAEIDAPFEAADAAAAHTRHKDDDIKLFRYIIINLDGEAADIAQQVPPGHGRALWDTLSETYGVCNTESLIKQLLAMEGSHFPTVTQYVRALQCKMAEIQRTGQINMGEVEAATFRHLSRQLPSNYQHIAHAANKAKQKWSLFCKELITFQATIDPLPLPQQQLQLAEPQAYATTTERRTGGYNYNGSGGGGEHRGDERDGDGGRGGGRTGRGGGSGRGGPASFSGMCNLCGREGHRAAACRTAMNAIHQVRQQQQHRGGRGGPAQANVAEAANTDTEQPLEFGFLCYDNDAALMAAMQTPPGCVDWIADSGASSHITGSAALLRATEATDTAVRLADRTVRQAKGVGTATVTVSTLADNQSALLHLHNTLLLPGAVNLFSLPRFTAVQGNQAVLTQTNPHLRLSDGTELPLLRHNGLFILRATAAPATNTETAALTATTTAVPATTKTAALTATATAVAPSARTAVATADHTPTATTPSVENAVVPVTHSQSPNTPTAASTTTDIHLAVQPPASLVNMLDSHLLVESHQTRLATQGSVPFLVTGEGEVRMRDTPDTLQRDVTGPMTQRPAATTSTTAAPASQPQIQAAVDDECQSLTQHGTFELTDSRDLSSDT
jgi:hypothetical protein